MFKKFITAMAVVAIVMSMAAPSQAFSGEVIVQDMGYGAIIGGLLGTAVYLVDSDDAGQKIGTGVALGLVGGFFMGITDVSYAMEIKGDKAYVAMPTIMIDRDARGTSYSAGLLKVNF